MTRKIKSEKYFFEHRSHERNGSFRLFSVFRVQKKEQLFANAQQTKAIRGIFLENKKQLAAI